MELFNVTKNRYFLAVQILINRIYSGEKMTCAQFDEQLSLLSGDTDRASLNFCGVLKKDMDIFDFSDNEHVRLKISGKSMAGRGAFRPALPPVFQRGTHLSHAWCPER